MPTRKFQTLREVKDRFPGVVFRAIVKNDAAVFVKSSSRNVFESEAAGLDALRQTKTIRVAEVFGVGEADSGYTMVLEAIESTSPSGDFFERFGRSLASLHRGDLQHQTPPRFGFEKDNFLGATPQPNPWTSDWTEFWSESRLGFQLNLARENGYGGKELQSLGENLRSRLDSLISEPNELPAIIHGDLWSGNWLCDENNQPVLIDPAAYYANREAEFGMTTLFGGLPKQFYEAYNEAWPMEHGWQERVAIYRLYHLLNHLNLFGNSYLSDCFEILRRFT